MKPSQTQRVKDICTFIKTSSPEQRVNFLRGITKNQCSLIRQIAYNVLLNPNIKLSDKNRRYIKRHLVSVKELASRRICLERKRLILVKKHLLIKRLCSIVYEYLP